MGTNTMSLAAWRLPILLALVGMQLAAAPSAAETASDLLQKAIYTEETVGNLDEAMKLYEQVIAEAKAGQEAGAQAQYRLALCHEKKGQDAEARKAFETLIQDYPEAEKLVAEARKHLPGKELKLLPAPWKMGERQQLNMTLASGLPIGTMIYMVDASPVDGVDDAERGGEQVTHCSTRGLVTINGTSSYSEVYCQTESFAPIESYWMHSMLGEAKAVYGEDSAKITVLSNGKTFTLDFSPPAFDNEQCAELFRRLPLAEGYQDKLTVVTSLGGTVIEIPLSVSSIEEVTVPAGTFECYKLELGMVNQTFWISNDARRNLVRFAAGGVWADLAKVWHAEPGQGETASGDGFSVTLPAGWLFYDSSNPEKSSETELRLLDPRANAESEIDVRPKSELEGEQAKSTEAWTKSFIDNVKNKLPDFAVDDAGLIETQVDGHQATQMVANFTQGDKKMRMLGVAVIGDQSAATLRFNAEAKKFDELRGQFDEIVKNFKLK